MPWTSCCAAPRSHSNPDPDPNPDPDTNPNPNPNPNPNHTEVPVVTVAHGLVYGGGQGLWAGAATFRVAAEDARLAMPEAAIGLVPDAGMGK